MKITFLGTGTSHGVPMIGCECPVCSSNNPKNKRTRCSVYVETGNLKILIDTPPEMRIQMVREKISKVDAILFTHAHADHLFGLDDIRRFNDISKKPVPCYGNASTLATMRKTFEYIFKTPIQVGGGLPSVEQHEANSTFDIFGTKIIPIPVMHGRVPVLGYRINNFAYVTDCSVISDLSMNLLKNLDVLVLGVIRYEPHPTHLCISQGLEIIQKLKPKQTYFTHITHRLDYDETNRNLPEDVCLSYDGLKIEI